MGPNHGARNESSHRSDSQTEGGFATCVVMERLFVRVMTTRRDIAVSLSMVATQQPLRFTSNSSFLMQNWTHLVIGCFHAFAVGSIPGKRLGQGRCFQPCPCVSFLQHH